MLKRLKSMLLGRIHLETSWLFLISVQHTDNLEVQSYFLPSDSIATLQSL